MRIAVIGSGIAGLASAWLLDQMHEVTLFECNDHLGGHTHTHRITLGEREFDVDTGFIVFNRPHYPLLSRVFDTLGVESQPTTMSFALKNERSGLEYSATNLHGLFCQPRNLVSPRFMRMLGDILRFYRQSPTLLEIDGAGPDLGDYLAEHRYSDTFRDDHLLPMASALWSSPSAEILRFPAKYLVQFMANHQMLQVAGRPQWRVVKGGSKRYIEAMQMDWSVAERLNCAVTGIVREAHAVRVDSAAGSEHYDHVVMTCHSDDALRLLSDADERERAILGAMPYQDNDTVLHTDARLLPRRRAAWAAWNALVAQDRSARCTVSYCMNMLQSLDAPEPLIVTLNRTDRIAPEHILRRMRYRHPLYSRAFVAAQSRKTEIQGRRRTWFAGAYWGWGFHEDGMRSAVDVANALGVRWP